MKKGAAWSSPIEAEKVVKKTKTEFIQVVERV